MSDNELKYRSTNDLELGLKVLEANLHCTEIQIKSMKKELECRKQKVPLGVPLKGTLNEMPLEIISKGFLEWFSCEASADKFEEYFVNFVRALQDIAEGKLIDIKALFPLLRKGYVAMDEDKRWYWFKHKPNRVNAVWTTTEEEDILCLSAFNLKPAEDWSTSLMECGL